MTIAGPAAAHLTVHTKSRFSQSPCKTPETWSKVQEALVCLRASPPLGAEDTVNKQVEGLCRSSPFVEFC